MVRQCCLHFYVEICRTEFPWTVDGVVSVLSDSGSARCHKVQEQNRSLEEITKQESRADGITTENVDYFSFVRPKLHHVHVEKHR